MKPVRFFSPLVIATICAFALPAAVHAEEAVNTIKFSDPSKPCTLKIMLARGAVHVEGSNTNEVSVKSDTRTAQNKPRKDGLRVLTLSSSVALTEKDNVVTLDATSDGPGRSADLRVTVPGNTSLVIQSSFGGSIDCRNVGGDIEIHSLNGEISLDGVTGGVVVDTMNGEITASIRELRPNKPLSFTSMNGEVVLRVPPDGKANVRLRTQNGSVLTDFDDTVLVTKTENSPRSSSQFKFSSSHALPPEATEAIRNAARIAAQASREAIDAAREGMQAAREADRARKRTDPDATADTPPPAPAIPPAPAVPPAPPRVQMSSTMTGGKLVTGTLNGGGPEISVATMNGDVTLRKLEAK